MLNLFGPGAGAVTAKDSAVSRKGPLRKHDKKRRLRPLDMIDGPDFNRALDASSIRAVFPDMGLNVPGSVALRIPSVSKWVSFATKCGGPEIRLLHVSKVSPKMEPRIVVFALGLLSAKSRNSVPKLSNVFASRLGLLRSCVSTWLVCRRSTDLPGTPPQNSDPADRAREVALTSTGIRPRVSLRAPAP
jgi:hypothetical protein